MELLRSILLLLHLARHFRMCFYWTRQVTGAPELIWGIFLTVFPDKTFHIQGLDLFCNNFLTKAPGVRSQNY